MDDSYLTWQRVVGLYPVAAVVSTQVIKGLHQRLQASFLLPPDQLPVEGRLQRYQPVAGQQGFTAYPQALGDIDLPQLFARPERFLLWPFGVESPGAMRQYGTHAIAFYGRRHLDDPYLLDTLLEPR